MANRDSQEASALESGAEKGRPHEVVGDSTPLQVVEFDLKQLSAKPLAEPKGMSRRKFLLTAVVAGAAAFALSFVPRLPTLPVGAVGAGLQTAYASGCDCGWILSESWPCRAYCGSYFGCYLEESTYILWTPFRYFTPPYLECDPSFPVCDEEVVVVCDCIVDCA